MDDNKALGLERVKKWLYAKGLEGRSSGRVLCGSCYGHGPANPMEDEPGFKTKCPRYEFYRFQRFTPKSRWLMSQRVFHGLDFLTPELKGIKLLHGAEYLERLRQAGKLKLGKAIRRKITYHDPCHLGRSCGVYEPPRNLLRSIEGVELVEMPRIRRWAWCCGGGGGVPEAYPELAKWNAEDRLQEAEQTGAELLLTTSPLCLRAFANLSQDKLQTEGLFEFIYQAL